MPPRVPKEEDFDPLRNGDLPLTLTWPKPAELTTSFLIIFHGLGDSHTNFTPFAEGLNLPHCLCITVRGTNPLPMSLLAGLDDPLTADGQPKHFHYGDDIKIDPASEGLDPDPGFEKAEKLIMDQLVRGLLIEKLGWDMSDIMFFGFGQGGSLALGLASKLRFGPRVEEVSAEGKENNGGDAEAFNGVLSLGGPLPRSMVPSVSDRQKARTKVMTIQLEEDEAEAVNEEFENVEVVNWKRKGVGMPGEREEMVPIMRFFADGMKKAY